MGKIYSIGFDLDIIDFLADSIFRGNSLEKSDLSSIAVVTPGKRPQIYLRKALAKRMKRAFFAPRGFSIEEFIGYLAKQVNPSNQAGVGNQPVGIIDACFLIYQIIQNVKMLN